MSDNTRRDCLSIIPWGLNNNTGILQYTSLFNSWKSYLADLSIKKLFRIFLTSTNPTIITSLGKFNMLPLNVTSTIESASVALPNNLIGNTEFFIPISNNNQPIVNNELSTRVSNAFYLQTIVPTPGKSKLVVDITPTFTQRISNPSLNFAILRPKEDETSVIIEYEKLKGDVSQAVLIPQDASDAIKAATADIFSSINPSLIENQQ
jgi:hypothetical protein